MEFRRPGLAEPLPQLLVEDSVGPPTVRQVHVLDTVGPRRPSRPPTQRHSPRRLTPMSVGTGQMSLDLPVQLDPLGQTRHRAQPDGRHEIRLIEHC